MIVIVIWLLMILEAAVGLADGAARLERAMGRDAFRSVQARSAADAAVAGMAAAAWDDSLRSAAGPVWPQATVAAGPVVVERWLERLPGSGDLWLVSARAAWTDLGGRIRAASLRGLIVRFQVTDTTGLTVPQPVARPALAGFQ